MFKKILITLVSAIIVMNCIGCASVDKEIILLKDVKSQSKVEEQEIKNAIENGNKYLEEENYDKAKKWYEKAISMSKANVDTYKKIKDKYLEKGRSDDAYRIVRLAIDNKVDVNNMKKELGKIENTFEPIYLNKKIYLNEKYQLPNEMILNINGIDISGKISWHNSNVNNDKIGTFTYTGSIPQYGRKVIMNLKIEKKDYVNTEVGNSDSREIKKEIKLCFIKSLSEEKGYKYALVDEVEYFNETVEKDQEALVDKETGEHISYPGLNKEFYWIKNSNPQLVKYLISDNCEYVMLDGTLTPDGTIYENKNITFKDMKDHINRYFSYNKNGYGELWWVYIENDVIMKLDRPSLRGSNY